MSKSNKLKLGKKILYILFSILMSIILWSYVAYVDNPDVSIPVSNVPITFEGEDILADNSLIVTDISAESLSFKATGKRNAVSKISADNVTVSVNLADIVSAHGTSSGTYQLPYSISFIDPLVSSNISISNATCNFVAVHVEKLASAKVQVLGTFNGKVADGFSAMPITFDTEEITVSGPSEIINKIDHAWVELNVNYEIDSSLKQECQFNLIDAAGKVISDKDITFSRDTVVANVKVLMIKDVALSVNISDTSSSVKDNYTIKIDPGTISLSGDADELAELNAISLGTIDLNSFSSNYSKVMNIVIPDGMQNLTGTTVAKVDIQILGLDTKSFTTGNITLKNIPEGMDAKINTQFVDVLLRGTEQQLEAIDEDDIKIVVSLSELSNNVGTYSIDGKVTVDGFSDVDAIGTYPITVNIS